MTHDIRESGLLQISVMNYKESRKKWIVRGQKQNMAGSSGA